MNSQVLFVKLFGQSRLLVTFSLFSSNPPMAHDFAEYFGQSEFGHYCHILSSNYAQFSGDKRVKMIRNGQNSWLAKPSTLNS